MNAIILFDGECNFCNGSVNFIIERDAGRYFKFAPNQSEVGERILREYRINKAETDSVILIEDGAVYLYSTAALRIARRLDGAWSLFYAFIIVPSFIRDFFYKLFAKYRLKLFGKKDTCAMPTPELRERFIT